MIAVLFEVLLAEGKIEEYLDLASELRCKLIDIEGFISIERFQSISNPDKILSLSFWENEEAVSQWRNNELHRITQQKGRESIFTNYRLRVSVIRRDYGLLERDEAPADSQSFHHS